jgi:hypothetical protein
MHILEESNIMPEKFPPNQNYYDLDLARNFTPEFFEEQNYHPSAFVIILEDALLNTAYSPEDRAKLEEMQIAALKEIEELRSNQP